MSYPCGWLTRTEAQPRGFALPGGVSAARLAASAEPAPVPCLRITPRVEVAGNSLGVTAILAIPPAVRDRSAAFHVRTAVRGCHGRFLGLSLHLGTNILTIAAAPLNS